MEHNDPTAAIILGEIALILFVILAGLLTALIIKKRKKAKQLGAALSKLDDWQEQRSQALLNRIAEASGADKEKLKAITEAIAGDELSMQKTLIMAYIKSDAAAFETLDNELDKLSGHYINAMTLKGKPATDTKAAEEEPLIPDMDDAVDDLLAEESDEMPIDTEFDLSETDDLPDVEAEEIAEIPDELINTNN